MKKWPVSMSMQMVEDGTVTGLQVNIHYEQPDPENPGQSPLTKEIGVPLTPKNFQADDAAYFKKFIGHILQMAIKESGKA